MPRTNYTHMLTQAEIMARRRDGETIKSIAKQCKVNFKTVRKFTKDIVQVRPPHLADAGAYIKTLLDQGYFNQPWTFRGLQKELERIQLPLSVYHLSKVLKELGFRKVWVHLPKESV